MIKAIIFDCFGVVYIDSFGEVYKHFGGDLEKDEGLIEQIFFDASKGLIPSGINPIAKHLGITRAEWFEVQNKINGFNTELLEYTKVLSKTYKISMLSNIGQSGLASLMDYSVLEEHFEDIVESAKIGFAKPEARAYEIAADRLGVRLDECIFIDDRLPYVEGAQHVGMKSVLYTDLESLKIKISEVIANVQ